jgi:hypothetical protein
VKELRIRVTYIEELLGTASANKELHSEFIASKAPDAPSREEEVEALGAEAVEEKAMTVFPRFEDGTPFLYDYQWKGFFKESCGMLRRGTGYKSGKLTAFKKVIDGLVFVTPRKVALVLPDGGKVGELQRPLRASTAQGERIALAHSETVPAGTTQKFTVKLLKDDLAPLVREWLDYGELHGTGQWRNAGKGAFCWKELDENGKAIGGNYKDYE